MQGSQTEVVHLYEFDLQSVNHKELTSKISQALTPYLDGKNPEIKIRGRPHKYWAYLQVDQHTCTHFLIQPRS